jgi:hypothetical protein
MTSSSTMWSNPKKVNERTKRTMDKTFRQGDKALEREEGTLDGWLRSVGSVELALFSFTIDRDAGDFFPQIDFAVSFESPAAIEMFGAISKMMVDRGEATKNERGDLILGFPGFTPLLSIQGSRIIMASSEDRLNAVVAALKNRMPNPLSSDPTFRACLGESASPSVLFVRFGALLQLIRDVIPERAQKRMSEIINPLGLTKIVGIGYHEEGSNGVVIAKASEPIQGFKLLKGKQGPPGILEKMPADCAFTIGRTDELGPHLQRIQKFLTDPTFPFNKEVGEGVEALTATTGLKLDQIFAPLKGGVVFAGVPDDHGKFDDENGFVAVAKVTAREDALALFSQMKAGSKSGGDEMEQTEADGLIWLKPKKAESRPAGEPTAEGGERTSARPPIAPPPAPAPPDLEPGEVRVVDVSVGESRPGTDSRTAERRARMAAGRARRAARVEREKPKPMAVWTGEVVIAGMEPVVLKTLAAQRGQGPTLATSGALKKLPQQATYYMTSSLRSMFAGENSFTAALSLLKDFGNTGSSIVVEDDIITFVSNRTTAEQIGSVIAAGAMGEDGRDERREILDQLNEIGSRTKAFYEKNKKWPASLAELGYSAKEMPSAKDSEGKPHAIVFLPPKPTATLDDWQGLLAYFPSNDFGRLAVSVAGTAWSWSEADFLSALAKYNTATK